MISTRKLPGGGCDFLKEIVYKEQKGFSNWKKKIPAFRWYILQDWQADLLLVAAAFMLDMSSTLQGLGYWAGIKSRVPCFKSWLLYFPALCISHLYSADSLFNPSSFFVFHFLVCFVLWTGFCVFLRLRFQRMVQLGSVLSVHCRTWTQTD